MLRRMVLASAIVACSAAFSGADESDVTVAASLGGAWPSAPDEFADFWSTGGSIAGDFGYHFSDHVSAHFELSYDRVPVDEGAIDQIIIDELGFDPGDLGVDVSVEGGAVTVVSGTASLKGSLVGRSRPSPYVQAGVGFARFAAGDITSRVSGFGETFTDTSDGTSETAILMSFGAGFDLPIGDRFGLFVDGRYKIVFTDDERTELLTARAGVRIGL